MIAWTHPRRPPQSPTRRALGLPAVLCLLGPVLLRLSGPAAAQQIYLQPPPADATSRCAYFSRLQRFTEESKAMCDDGRQVKVGPVTTQILAQCRAAYGHRFETAPTTDLMEALGRQVQSQGLGNACHTVDVQVWNMISQ